MALLVQVFVVKHYQPRLYEFPEFEDSFRALLRDAEAAADLSKHAPVQRKQLAGSGKKVSILCYPLHAAYWWSVRRDCLSMGAHMPLHL